MRRGPRAEQVAVGSRSGIACREFLCSESEVPLRDAGSLNLVPDSALMG